MKRVIVSRNRYFDSVFLMQVAQRMSALPGMREASALLATDANKKVLAELGYGDGGRDAAFAEAGANDLVIALDGDEAAVAAIVAAPESWLQRSVEPSQARRPRSIAEAVATRPDASIALISVPGEYAAREARFALEQGLDVFLFSSNVPVADERSLKTMARDKGLILMGPDCGTAYIAGAGLGFANVVRQGPIGIVAASGTGMQEFSCLVHRAGCGVSHGIGVGSRDLSDDIDGISTFTALDALEADPRTRVVAVIAKPPGKRTEARLLERCLRSTKPVVLCLLGAGVPSESGLLIATTLDQAADMALHAAGHSVPVNTGPGDDELRQRAEHAVSSMQPQQRNVRGLFAGGTFCYQAQVIFRSAGLVVHSNAPVAGMRMLDEPRQSVDTSFIDMGAEMFVKGRPHPMIDATLRRKRLLDEASDATVALVLLDVVLGANASPDPAGDMLPAIREAMAAARRRGARLCVAASVCGTDEDAQDLAAQGRVLAEAGVQVFASAAQAAGFARDVALLLAARPEEP